MTPPARVLLAGDHGKRPRQPLPREAVRFDPYLQSLRYRDVKVFRLFGHAIRDAHVGLRRIDEVEPEDVFLPARADVEAIAIVRFVLEKGAVLVGLPMFLRARAEDGEEARE